MKTAGTSHLREDYPHRRLNQLTGEWVLVSPHRLKRPWQGKKEASFQEQRPAYDPGCYLCPGNARAHGATNPAYTQTFVFTNDFPALLPEVPGLASTRHSLLQSESIRGTCRVLCFSPRHDLTLAEMGENEMHGVIRAWTEQVAELGKTYQWVQVFENKGELMGCSNAHPHGQIWAGSALPNEPRKEDRQQRAYLDEHGSPLLLDYVKLETLQQERLVSENEHWLVCVPYWAIWPYELLLLPRRHVLHLPDLSTPEQESLAAILKIALTKLDNLFGISFPYSMGWHGAPEPRDQNLHWQLHAHFYPPLLRSHNIKKFLVGYEMLAEAQRDMTAENAAQVLRQLPGTR